MLPRLYMFFDPSGGSSVAPECPELGPASALPVPKAENMTARATATASSRVIAFRGSDRISILFAVFTLVCGLYCTGYLFRSSDPEHRIAPWPREFFYQRPPDLASGILDESLAKKTDSLQGPAVNRSFSRVENAGDQPNNRTSSSSVPERPSLPPIRQSNPALGQPNGAAPGSSNGGYGVAKGGVTQGIGAGKGSGSGTSMKTEKSTSGQGQSKKSGQASNGSSMGTGKCPTQVTSHPANNDHAVNSAHNAGREAIQAARSNLANQRAQRTIFSQMRTLSGGQRAMSGVRGSRGGGHHR